MTVTFEFLRMNQETKRRKEKNSLHYVSSKVTLKVREMTGGFGCSFSRTYSIQEMCVL